MAKQYICLVLLVEFISIAVSKRCSLRTESGVMQQVCCADYEANENNCVACPKGYTSVIGQHCKPCSRNSYGDRCRHECSCLRSEIKYDCSCDNVEGCVEFATTTDTSKYATSSMFMQHSNGKSCESKTESGQIIKVCCTDYEEKGNECIPCTTGYTSEKGQNCTSCPKNTYGERCKYDCSCSDFEICDNVKGCVGFPLTIDTSVYTTPYDRTYKLTKETGTYSGSDITSSYQEANTNGESTDCSVQGLLSREIIVYSALSVLVIYFGICLCCVFFKYKTLTKTYTVSINQTPISSIPQQIQNIEIADRLYDIINEEDILDDRRIQQMQKEMSSEYLDVIHDSNTTESCENKSSENHDNPCQLQSIDQPQNLENNLKVDDRSLMSGDSTSFSDEYHQDSTQDYLNPYQPMMEISPPEERKYLTIATANYKDTSTNL